MKTAWTQAIRALMVVAALGTAAPLHAQDVAPHVVTAGGALKMSLDECMRAAKAAADKKEFTEKQEAIVNSENNTGDFFAFKESPYSLHVNCDAGNDIWTVGVGARDRQGAQIYLIDFMLEFPEPIRVFGP
ncbi:MULTISPECIES: hypothetical protein [Aphanothece]|uniref:hypothetical protein n=1 Tax=Aphanothece TaxID=1121 RepID=UPI00398534F4